MPDNIKERIEWVLLPKTKGKDFLCGYNVQNRRIAELQDDA